MTKNKITPLDLWKFFENNIEKYNIYLNPNSVKIPAQIKGRTIEFEINPNQIICIRTFAGRAKKIYLRKPIESISGELRTDIIPINKKEYTLEKLCEMFDGIQFRLLIISKSDIVNVNYYNLVKKELKIRLKNYTRLKECGTIPIRKQFVEYFLQKKNDVKKIVSLQKKLIGYKSDNLD